MSKLFKENGFLSEEGQQVLSKVKGALEDLFSSKEVKDLSETELRTLGSNLSALVGNTISDRLQAKREVIKKFEGMDDKQFQAYLVAKYGDNWMFQSLTPDELDRCPKLQQQEIENILKESAKHVTKFPRNGVRFR